MTDQPTKITCPRGHTTYSFLWNKNGKGDITCPACSKRTYHRWKSKLEPNMAKLVAAFRAEDAKVDPRTQAAIAALEIATNACRPARAHAESATRSAANSAKGS